MHKLLIKALVLLLVLVLLVPIFTVLSYLFRPNGEVWQHLMDTVLLEYISNSLVMAVGATGLTVLIGVTTAWLTSMYRLPAQRWLPFLLMLPMAMPSYIIAFTYSGLLDTSGLVQEWYREMTGLSFGDYWFPELHNVYGATAMLSFVLYPYVFLLVRASFLTQSVSALQAGEILGLNPWQRFLRIALPLARPALVAGIALVVMETLSDYGTVQYYGVPTFTTGIFSTWYGLDDVVSAMNLSAMLVFFVMLLFGLEAYSRRKIDYSHAGKSSKTLASYRKTPSKPVQWLMLAWCLLPVLVGFVIPVAQLGIWALEGLEYVDEAFVQLCWHSFMLAFITAIIAVVLTFCIYAYQRYYQSALVRQSFRLVNLGYAIPGIVVALGVIIPTGYFSDSIGWLNGTFMLLIFAYLVRFLAVALGSIESGYDKIKTNVDDAARTLNVNFFGMLWRVHLPLMTKVMLTAVLIIFVDVLKELPITLVLRPFNFNTLAVNAFELASDEFLDEAALPAMFIVLTGILPVWLLQRSIDK